MTRRSIHCFAAVLAAMVLTSAGAMAAPGETGSLEFGPYVGWVKWDDYGLFKPDDAVLYGGRFGAFLSPYLSAEAAYQLNHSEAGPQSQDFNLNSIRVNALW